MYNKCSACTINAVHVSENGHARKANNVIEDLHDLNTCCLNASIYIEVAQSPYYEWSVVSKGNFSIYFISYRIYENFCRY